MQTEPAAPLYPHNMLAAASRSCLAHVHVVGNQMRHALLRKSALHSMIACTTSELLTTDESNVRMTAMSLLHTHHLPNVLTRAIVRARS